MTHKSREVIDEQQKQMQSSMTAEEIDDKLQYASNKPLRIEILNSWKSDICKKQKENCVDGYKSTRMIDGIRNAPEPE